MDNELRLLKNNDNRSDTDLEWVNEFYEFLQGNIPSGITLGRGGTPKLSRKQAFSVIWYLQEHFPLLPDHIECCPDCTRLYDSHSEGYYSEARGKTYCGSCIPPGIEDEDERLADNEKVPIKHILGQIPMITDYDEEDGVVTSASTESWAWMIYDKKGYEKIEQFIKKQSKSTMYYSINCFCDISGFEYWDQRKMGDNYFTFNIHFAYNTMPRKYMRTLQAHLEQMKENVEEYIKKISNSLQPQRLADES